MCTLLSFLYSFTLTKKLNIHKNWISLWQKLRNKQYMNMFLHVIGVSTLIFVLSTDICKGLFTWRWGILGRWGNPLRWGNPPVNIWSPYLSCTYMNEMRDYMDRQVTSPTWDVQLHVNGPKRDKKSHSNMVRGEWKGYELLLFWWKSCLQLILKKFIEKKGYLLLTLCLLYYFQLLL